MDDAAVQVGSAFDALFAADAGPLDLVLKVLLAAVLLFAGWLLAALLRRFTLFLLQGAGRVGRSLSGMAEAADPRFAQATIRVVAGVVFWAVLAVVVALVGQLLDLSIVERGSEALIGYLPSLASGILVILAGTILSGLAYPVVLHAAESAGLEQGQLLGRVTQALILVAAGVIAATQFRLDVSFLSNVALIIVAATAGAFALGLALGTPQHVTNVISARQIRRSIGPGDRVEIDGCRGTVLDISATHVVLECEAGETMIPARRFAETAFTRLLEDDSGSG